MHLSGKDHRSLQRGCDRRDRVQQQPGIPQKTISSSAWALPLLGWFPFPASLWGVRTGLILAATPVSVKIQAASFRALNDGVQALLASGILNRQQAGSLKDEISAASNAADRGDFATAVSVIEQFQADISRSAECRRADEC